jgi:hypothetical protein
VTAPAGPPPRQPRNGCLGCLGFLTIGYADLAVTIYAGVCGKWLVFLAGCLLGVGIVAAARWYGGGITQ